MNNIINFTPSAQLLAHLITINSSHVVCNKVPTENWSLSFNTFLSVIWRRPTNVCVLRRHFDSEAYPSGLSEHSGRPTEVLHCVFFERHFWQCRQ